MLPRGMEPAHQEPQRPAARCASRERDLTLRVPGRAQKVTPLMPQLVPGAPMRITVALADDLVRTAQQFAGGAENTALLRKALIEQESARRLASLGRTIHWPSALSACAQSKAPLSPCAA